MTGCSSITKPEKEIVVQVKERFVIPPPAYLSPCRIPYTEPPRTHSEVESAERDLTWQTAMFVCAKKFDKIKQWYQNKQADK
ncbi:Rz1-like lysis system protein LysC [Vibrio sp. S9_S30]|uniref:Rz1-like lysis system protein LysC n=1 Tax=Vibrio sp. S9_S30 TaxID=2720226 RepID=UPI00406C1EEA